MLLYIEIDYSKLTCVRASKLIIIFISLDNKFLEYSVAIIVCMYVRIYIIVYVRTYLRTCNYSKYHYILSNLHKNTVFPSDVEVSGELQSGDNSTTEHTVVIDPDQLIEPQVIMNKPGMIK